MRVNGRGKLSAALACDESGDLRLRLEDDRNPEFWAEILITAQDIRAAQETTGGVHEPEDH
jgi:hypothetical protein